MSRTPAPPARSTDAAPPQRVSHRHDASERQADRAADIVARGGSVTGWSFANVPAEASVHRDEDEPKKLEDKPRPQGEAYKEGAGKAVEAATETELPSGKRVREVIEESPVLSAAAASALALSGKDVPLPLGSIPGVKDVAPPGLSVGVRAEGVPGLLAGDPRPGGRGVGFSDVGLGLTLGYTEQLPKGGKKRQSAADKKKAAIAADIARLRNDPIIKGLQAQQDKEVSDAAIASVLARQKFAPAGQVPGLPRPIVPPMPLDAPKAEEQKKPEDAVKAEEQKKREEVQRAPATTSEAAPAEHFDTTGVDAATRGGGRALDPGLRHSMEARFGYDFSSVRLHDDPQAASAAAGVDATAFTVGEHIVFGSGRFDPSSPQGRHLIAHELAHVVQQRGGAAPRSTGAPARVQRRSFWEKLAVFFGAEGTWSDAELRSYLAGVTASRAIEGAYDSDNKARAVVGRWKKDPVAFMLRPAQKALLIDEMIDGPTLNDDEDAILDLLESSGADDLRWIFFGAAARYDSLKSNLHGDQDDRFDAFVAARFLGGAAALKRGEVAVTGPTVGGVATFAMNNEYLEARIRDEDASAAEILALIERSSPRNRARIFDYLWRNTWPATIREAGQVARSFAGEKDGDRKDRLEKRLDGLKKRIRTLNVLLGRFFAEKLPANAADLEATTRALTGKAAEEAKAALTPKVHEPLPEDRAPDPDADSADADTAGSGAESTKTEGKDEPGDTKETPDDAKREAERKLKAARRREKKFGVKSKYRRDMEKALRKVIASQYRSMVLQAGTRVAHSEIAPIADIAREQTRAVLGGLFDVQAKDLTSDTAAPGGNVHSWYETRGEELKALGKGTEGPERLRKAAIEQIMKHFAARETLRGVNARYGAAPTFKDDAGTNVEGRTLVTIARDVTAEGPSADGLDNPITLVDKVNATYRNWGGIRRGSQVYVNLFETGDEEADRLARWDKLRTLVHEYIHTLRHDDYTAFADSFGEDSVERHTLIEAVDELLLGMVWAHLAPRLTRPEVRAKVEGARYANLPPVAVPDPHHYASLPEAMALVKVAGVENVAAAYFLGLVDRIGGPSRPAPREAAPPRRRGSATRSGAKAPVPPRGRTRGTARGKGAK